MLNTDELLNKIKTMPEEELAAIVREALDVSGIPYEIGKSQIIFDGLLPEDK